MLNNTPKAISTSSWK